MISDLLKKYGFIVLALVVTFAAGRYTMRSKVQEEVETKYSKLYVEMLADVEERFSVRLKESVEAIREEVKSASLKMSDVDEKIEVKPDGTHNITRKIRSREKTKTKTTAQKDVKVVEVEKEVEKIVVQKEFVEVEKQVVKEVEKVIPPPSWRVYGVAAVSAPTTTRERSYGAGAMYDIGPVSVGGFGLVDTEREKTTVGFTVGVVF